MPQAIMIKTVLICLALLTGGEIFAQYCGQCAISAYIYYQFINFPLANNTAHVYRNVVEYAYNDNEAEARYRYKHSEEYLLLHNGDYVKGAQGLFSGDIEGAGWLKNFDFGKFLSFTIELEPDNGLQPRALYNWTGQLLFFKLVKKKPLGARHYQ